MSLPEVIQSDLVKNNIQYQFQQVDLPVSFYHDADKLGLSSSCLVRCCVIKVHNQHYLLILRADDLLDFSSLKTMYGESINLAHDYQIPIPGAESASRVPLPSLHRIDVVVDKVVFDLEKVHIDAGIEGAYLTLNGNDFKNLHKDASVGSFSSPISQLNKIDYDDWDEQLSSFTPLRMRQRVEETFDLPAMPTIAQEVMKLRVDQRAGAPELANIVSQDPSLSAQVVSWASSPYYGYQGNIDSLSTAISRVLGFDLVLNLALGISVGKSLNVSPDGPLGLNAYWRQSVYTATLAEKLCGFIHSKKRPQRGLVYLAGLLHNFGQLLLGHLFPPQFYLINRYVEMNPHIPVIDIEYHLLGLTHVELGAWLMDSWNMPEELIAAVRWHHQEECMGEHSVYANIVLIANRLLRRINISDSTQIELPESILDIIGLNEDDAFKALDLITDDDIELDTIAQQMVA